MTYTSVLQSLQRLKISFTFSIRFQPVIAAETWQNLLQFDEHTIQPSSKFGLLLQTYGQTKEEELFGNQIESPAFSEFLSFLGERVDLQVNKK